MKTEQNTKTQFKITKHHLQGAVAMLLVCVIAISALSLTPGVNLFGTTAASAKVEYLIEDGKKTGIKSITLDGIAYYDIYGGKAQEHKENIQFFMDVLRKDDPKANMSPLNAWSQLAYLIFAASKDFVMEDSNDKKHDFADNWGNNRDSGKGYGDLVTDFQKQSEGRRGDIREDNTWWSGLAYANSLTQVRKIMADSIANNTGGNLRGDMVLKNTDGGNALKLLEDEKYQGDVLYTIVTGTERVGGTREYNYNSYGIAFYDFKLVSFIKHTLYLINFKPKQLCQRLRQVQFFLFFLSAL